MAVSAHEPMFNPELRRQFIDQIQHARDLPRAKRQPLTNAVTAVLNAHDEDRDDGDRYDPQPQSFAGLLRFVSHAHRADWAPPSLALNPEGNFVAVWTAAGKRYSVEFQDSQSAHWIITEKAHEGVSHKEGDYQCLDKYEAPPFTVTGGVLSY